MIEPGQHVLLTRVPEHLPTELEPRQQRGSALHSGLFRFKRTGKDALPGEHASGDHRDHSGNQQGADNGHAALFLRLWRG